ncbi:SDR family NAD(P)-dependent oxidoreductase [Pseudonocardia nigra]|uniref:SDR family NAD(P)-dependent oxidoreductase n=1 Tax=Pseudonocardia nigra TaxID=1921578 RepID=UPI0027E26DBA|nr:SDR family oxidoreductase [Pseudonocardia nigra]
MLEPSLPLRADALAGRTAVVTGGGSGIGRATAVDLARAGCRVVVAGRRRDCLDETVARIECAGGRALAVTADIREPDQVTGLVDTALDAFGRVDVLVNNAGGQFSAPAEQISVNGWRAVHRLAVEGSWAVTREVATRSMIANRSGLVVFVGFSPRRGIPGMAHASAARAALENLASGLAIEWARYGIRSVCVAPGTIATEGLEINYTDEERRRWESAVPLGRLGRPEDVAALIAFLATDAAAYITGTTLVVDGGADAWGAGHPAPALEGAGLEGAGLEGAGLEGAGLEGAGLEGAGLEGAGR